MTNSKELNRTKGCLMGLAVGDVVEIEYMSVDERIRATVSYCTLKDGKGIAIFNDGDKVYSGDHICKDCKMVVNNNFQFVGYYGN